MTTFKLSFAFCVKVCFWLLKPVAWQHIVMHMHVNGLKTPQAVNCFQHDTAVKMASLLQKKLSSIYSSNGHVLYTILKLSPTLTSEVAFCSCRFLFRTHCLKFCLNQFKFCAPHLSLCLTQEHCAKLQFEQP